LDSWIHDEQIRLAVLNEASAPIVSDYPYGGPGVQQRARILNPST